MSTADYNAQGDYHQSGAGNAHQGGPAPSGDNQHGIELKDGEIQSSWNETHETFDDMNLKPKLLRGIYGYGFEKPSSIQQRAIVPCIKQHDVIAQAQSGTGKTATFAISLLQAVNEQVKATKL